VKKTNHGIVVIVIYVDDLIITGGSNADIFDLKKLLKQKIEMKDLGELRYFLGIEVIQSPKGIWLLQRQYALNKLSEYGMTGCKPISTIGVKWEVKCRQRRPCGRYHYVHTHRGEFNLQG
jgi:hypothetical protein